MGEKIFISYRREDSQADAGRLSADLVREFGSDRVFTDIDNIPIGGSVKQRISDAIDSAAVVLVLIGPDWSLERLSNPDDWVRNEIVSAIEKHVPIIPIRLRRAKMPEASQLPEELAALVDYNGADIEHSSWRRDLPPIVDAIRLELNNANRGCAGGEPEADAGERRGQVSGRDTAKQHRTWLKLGVAAGGIAIIVAGAIVVTSSGGDEDSVPVADSPSSVPASAVDTAVSRDTTAASPAIVTTVPQTGFETIVLQAEDQILTPPMVAGTDLAAEGSAFVSTTETNAGVVRFDFEVTQGGRYFIWARVSSAEPQTNSDSIAVRLDNEEVDVWDFFEGDNEARVGWHWDLISTRCGGSFETHLCDPLRPNLDSARTHTLALSGREPYSAVDVIVVTNDPDYDPARS